MYKRISTSSVTEGITAVAPTPNRALMAWNEGSLAHDAQISPVLDQINPDILGYLETPRKDFDPRQTTQECACEDGRHHATTDFGDIQRRDALLVHVPFTLLEDVTPFHSNPLDRGVRKTEVGMRLAWQLHSLKGHEGFRFSTYSVGLWIAKALPIRTITHEMQTALQNSGCPNIQLDKKRGIGF